MSIKDENPVNAQTAAQILGAPGKPWGSTRMSAIKKAMGISGRYFFVSAVRQWLYDNPGFQERQIYPRTISKPQSNRRGRQLVTAGKSDERR
jgi:hypothetical protein